MLYNIYCQKFYRIDLEQELKDEEYKTGVSLLVNKVLDESALSMTSGKRNPNREVYGILKVIFGVFAVILIVLYYIGMYFAIFDEDSEIEKKRKKYENDRKRIETLKSRR